MKVLTALTTAVVLAAGLVTQAARAETLHAAALTNYAPYSDSSLPGKGFSNDLLVQAMQRAGYTVEVEMMPWGRALELTTKGDTDILPSAWYNQERAKSLIYSKPFATNRIVFVKRADDPFEFKSLADLKGKSVGIVIDYAYDKDFLAGTDYKLEKARDILSNLKKVAEGHVDLTLDDELTLTNIINTQAPDLKGKLALTHGAMAENPLYITFSRARPDAQKWADAFDKALADMRADGSYDRILAAHGMK